MEKQYEKIPSFTPDSDKHCKGHANFMLDHEYQDKESRDLLVNCLNNYIEKDTA
jgi:hypothetical protein